MTVAVTNLHKIHDNKAKANVLHNCNLLLTQQAVSTLSPSLSKTYVVVPLNPVKEDSSIRVNEPDVVQILDHEGMSVDRCRLSNSKLTDQQLEADLGMNQASVDLARACQNTTLEKLEPENILTLMESLGYDTTSLKSTLKRAKTMTVDEVDREVDRAVENAARNAVGAASNAEAQMDATKRVVAESTGQKLKRWSTGQMVDEVEVNYGPCIGTKTRMSWSLQQPLLLVAAIRGKGFHA
jgi:hypothetical protein